MQLAVHRPLPIFSCVISFSLTNCRFLVYSGYKSFVVKCIAHLLLQHEFVFSNTCVVFRDWFSFLWELTLNAALRPLLKGIQHNGIQKSHDIQWPHDDQPYHLQLMVLRYPVKQAFGKLRGLLCFTVGAPVTTTSTGVRWPPLRAKKPFQGENGISDLPSLKPRDSQSSHS